jgi:predicted phosphodiesterase
MEMATFRVISDIHLEFPKSLGNVSKFLLGLTPTKYLILAGDITTPSKASLISELPTLDAYKHVFCVLGNHDYYGDSPDPIRDELQTKIPNSILLDRTVFTTPDEGLVIAGCTLWSDITPRAHAFLNDSSYVSLADYHAKHKSDVEFLAGLSGADLVVTHHMPRRALISPRYASSQFNSAFATDVKEPPGCKVWVYGHTHERKETTINDVRFICNSVGYPGEIKGPIIDRVFTL